MIRPMVLAVVAVVTMGACVREVTPARLAGTYVMTLRYAADTLRLSVDGHYVRTFASPDKPVATDTGQWFLMRDKKMIGLRNYPKRWAFVHDLMGDTTGGRVLTMPNTVALTIEHTWNRTVRLAWYPQFGWRYRRVGAGE